MHQLAKLFPMHHLLHFAAIVTQIVQVIVPMTAPDRIKKGPDIIL